MKTILFRCQIENIKFDTPEELREIIEKIGLSIQVMHPTALIDPAIQVADMYRGDTQKTAFGDAVVDAYMEVKRSSGEIEYIHVVDGENHVITKEQYMAAHALH